MLFINHRGNIRSIEYRIYLFLPQYKIMESTLILFFYSKLIPKETCHINDIFHTTKHFIFKNDIQIYCERSEASEILLRQPCTISKMGKHATVMLFDVLFLENYERWKREILTQSTFKSSICAIKIWIRYLRQFGNYAFFRTQ